MPRLRCLEENGDAVEFALGIHQIHALVGDLEAAIVAAQPVLDQRAVEALLFAAELDELKGRVDRDLTGLFLGYHHVAHLMHGAGEGLPGVRARVARLLHSQLEQRAVVVDDRAGLERVFLISLQGNPVRRVVGEELEPGLELLGIQQSGLVVEKLFNAHWDL